ncbi:MAG: hypothetical protein AABW80_04565 [Nanoarchaeota archaeon]
MTEQSNKIIEEVLDEINSALNEVKGIVAHQRRLAFSLSLGTATLLEEYLKKKNILKPGIKINHLWLKKSVQNIKKLLESKITASPESLPQLNSILEKAHLIEKERDKIAYGKLITEKELNEKINLFIELKKEVENV